jgi:dsDNA-specific endonuclease/ATPase MutS2
MKTAMQELHDHFKEAWSSPGDLWRPDMIIEKVESMIEKEKYYRQKSTRELESRNRELEQALREARKYLNDGYEMLSDTDLTKLQSDFGMVITKINSLLSKPGSTELNSPDN